MERYFRCHYRQKGVLPAVTCSATLGSLRKWKWTRHIAIQSEVVLNPMNISPNGAGMAEWHSTGLRARWPAVRFPAGAGNFSLHHLVQTCSGAHPASYIMCTRGSFPGGEAAGTWSWPLTSIQCRGQEWVELYLTPQYAFMAWCSVNAQG
jgi:hypothetical protein